MSIDIIEQDAKTMLDIYKKYQALIAQKDDNLTPKIKQCETYIMKLIQKIQKCLEEEEHVS